MYWMLLIHCKESELRLDSDGPTANTAGKSLLPVNFCKQLSSLPVPPSHYTIAWDELCVSKNSSSFSNLNNPQLSFMLCLQVLITGQYDMISHCIFGGSRFPCVFEANLLLLVRFLWVNNNSVFFTNSTMSKNEQN